MPCRAPHAPHVPQVHEFLEAVVLLSFQRANPRYGQPNGPRTPEAPLPGCLEHLIRKQLLRRAKKDAMADLVKRLRVSREVRAVFQAKDVGALLKTEFERACSVRYAGSNLPFTDGPSTPFSSNLPFTVGPIPSLTRPIGRC